MAAISIPVKLLHEAEGHIVTVQTQTGEMFRGKLVEAEDNMNCLMQGTTVTYTNGKEVQMENVYIRGSKVVMLILPDMLRVAPMFRRGRGRGFRGGSGGFSRGSRGGMQRGRGGFSRGGYQAQTGYQGQGGYLSHYNLYSSSSQGAGSSYWK